MRHRFSLLLVTLALLVLVGCDSLLLSTSTTPSPTTPATLVGSWKSSFGDGFEVTQTTFTQYSDAASKTIWFQGNIVGSPSFTDTSASLTLLVTTRGSYGPAVGKYFVARWKSLTANGVKESTPYKEGGLADAESQVAAESEFTEANGYFSGPYAYGEYARQ